MQCWKGLNLKLANSMTPTMMGKNNNNSYSMKVVFKGFESSFLGLN